MDQGSLFEEENKPVECLGMTFKNDDERREYFRNELRKKLPDLKKIEGFPIGEDEDIIELSDPPYYTACPNPWMNEYVYIHRMKNKSGVVNEPLSVDITEGKNDAIYNAHSYHTKVPYKAIMRYLLHYTKPGDIVLDGFCGSGMTGVASEMCQDEGLVMELLTEKYSVDKVGKRNAVNIDLSPAATFIAYNYNKKKTEAGDVEVGKLISKLRGEFNWCFSTQSSYQEKPSDFNSLENFYNSNKQEFGEVNYIVWSEQYICSTCSNLFSFWESTVSEDETIVSKMLTCPDCNSKHEKKNLTLKKKKVFDNLIGKIVNIPDIIPVKINYTVNKKRFNKKPDWYDKEVIEYFETFSENKTVPLKKFDERLGNEIKRPIKIGYEYVHQIYTNRILSILDSYITQSNNSDAQFLLGSTLPKLTKMNRFMPQHGSRALVGPMANAMYFPPLSVENNVLSQLEFQLKKINKAWTTYEGTIISTQSSTSINLPDNSVDYIFIDPPFGANIMYSELNFIREAWLSVFTNNKKEAVENNAIGKDILEYVSLMGDSFKEFYRLLKPQKWITVEFSNTSAKIWNALQYVIQSSGFIIASVDALDKKRGGFHSMITTTAVKQDLVISAYKPDDSAENLIRAGEEASLWSFISQHLEKLTVFNGTKGNVVLNVERTPRIIFDRMVAYYIQKGIQIPISSVEFQEKITQKYVIRDGMVFLESQVAEYDKKRILAKEFSQQSLFVSDESSAIEWLRQQLMKKPQSRQDIHPQFMKEIQYIAKHEELPELDKLLTENFLLYDSEDVVPDQIAAYLRKNYHDMRGLENQDDKLKSKAKNRWYVPDPNKQADLEKLREKSLLREFNHYVEEVSGSKKKLKLFRSEAIRVGFKKAWSEKDYQKIVDVAEYLPEKIIQEDDKLLMFFTHALMRLDI